MPLHPLGEEWDADLHAGDPLSFPGYPEALVRADGESVRTGSAVAGTSASEAGVAAYALIEGRFEVLGGSMGAVTGEKVVRAYRRAVERRLPVVVLTASGGARMQEGMVSLVQMARTAAAASGHARAGLLSLAVYGQPTTGGVFASFASLVDLRAAVRGATVGFAGPRVVEQTLGTRLPEGSHTAESAHEAGLVDELLSAGGPAGDGQAGDERADDEQAAWVEAVLGVRDRPLRAPAPRRGSGSVGGAGASGPSGPPERADRRSVPKVLAAGRGAEAGAGNSDPWAGSGAQSPRSAHSVAGAPLGSAWQEVQRARALDRPTGIDHAASLCSSWVELHGTDPTVRAGLARVGGRRVVVVASDRFAADGRPRPAGFRLATRAVTLAAKLGLPVLTLVDTPGAHPGPDSEADGIAREIATTLAALAELPTASVSVCVGEGGSGGALALSFADRLLVQRHAVFSVIAPEGAAAILERDPSRAPSMAERLRLTSADLLDLGIADDVVDEAPGALTTAVERALAEAEPGDRHRRFDRATQPWVRR